MTKIETLICEYECCTDCGHAGFHLWDSRKREHVWGCGLEDRRLHYSHLMKKMPTWCPLPDKPPIKDI